MIKRAMIKARDRCAGVKIREMSVSTHEVGMADTLDGTSIHAVG
jgi:hypothetical protein